MGSPIEVQVWPDKIEVLSYPGPVPPVDAHVVRTQRRIVAREYRNRRIGDFLKELELTEGRGTGFPAIYDAMEKNGSPDPIFETDQDRNYFLATLPAHQGISNGVSNGATVLSFNTLDDLIQFSNGASNGAGKSAHTILSESIHDRVQEMLSILSNHKQVKEYVLFYNTERRHKSLGRITPDEKFYQEIKNVS
ncbi:ATP-binding protein [Sphingobacterium wenxiniae]|uniref:Putative ATP-dependent DNA helicase recG C-terminal n=1 Tax=Sphingobacterium wenxiniae TaxID=683125 RepID=A0A1I6NZK7_9SPHI|nr:ATP-binding protein [Sphingobacterium wenxiniae]SFS33382.1 Putative ATP-dependent DNA helicase recG C-terminal [Sphingobacterium wenxiniae]